MEKGTVKEFISNFFWKFGEQITSQIVTFIISIVLARLLAPSVYGLVAIINVFVILANVFVTSGLSTALIQKNNVGELEFSTIFWANAVLSCLIYIILFLIAPFIANFYHNLQLIPIFRVLSLSLPISAFNAIQLAYVSRHMLFRRVFISTSFASVLSGVLGIILAKFGFGVWSLVGQNLSNTVFSTIVLFVQLPWRPHLMFSWKSFRRLFDYGWEILVADFLGNFFAQLRNLVIGKFYTTSALAYYNRGDSFPTLISTNIDTTISSVLFPVLSKHSEDRKELKRMVRRSMRTSTYLIMPLTFGLAAVAKPLIITLLTKKWLGAVPFLQILSISHSFSTITNTNLQAMKASGRSDIFLKIELIKKPVYLVLLFISIKFSVIVVAWTMLIYSVYAALVNMGPNRQIIGYGYSEQIKDIGPSFLLALGMFIIVLPVSYLPISSVLMLIIQILLGLVVYWLGSLIFHLEPYHYLINLMKSKFAK